MLQKKPIKICDINVGKNMISKLVKIKTTSKYMIENLNIDIWPLALIMSKMGGYVKTCKVEE